MALTPTHREIEHRPTLSGRCLARIRRSMAGVRSGARPPHVAARHLWLLRDAVCVNFLRLALVAAPPRGGRLRYLPRATWRRLYALVTRVPRARASAPARLACLSRAVGAFNPSRL
ncbi:hypothetical protein [Streptomyces sp. NPDC045369]|uniref:hypothetical protein n=1 Tax=Streptomyces sp. NPDC045369 TaxID=3155732 RepID=UPI0033E63DAB